MFLMLCGLDVEKLWISFGQGDNHTWIPLPDVCHEIGIGKKHSLLFTLSQAVVSCQFFKEWGDVWLNGKLIL